MTPEALPSFAAWRHRDARNGFEVAFFEVLPRGHRVRGHTAAVEDGAAWVVEYSITVDATWTTKRAHVGVRMNSGQRKIELESVGDGEWLVDGAPAPHLAGCLDVDLEASALTNALPVHRLGLDVGQAAEAPAAYVHALDLRAERLEQRYARVSDDGPNARYDYRAPAFSYSGRLVYDRSGLLLRYPGLAERVA